MTVAESPIANQMPVETQKKILHATLAKDGFVLMASEMVMGGGFVLGNSFSLLLNCTSEEEIKKIFDHLSTDGKIKMPLAKTFWSPLYGELTDKFGIRWMLSLN